MEDNRKVFETKLMAKILVIAGVENMNARKFTTPNDALGCFSR